MSAELSLPLQADEIQWAVETELAHFKGDAAATIAALIRDRQFLRQQLELANFAGSRGFSRGWQPTYERD